MVKRPASNVDENSVVAEVVYPVFVTAWYEFPANSVSAICSKFAGLNGHRLGRLRYLVYRVRNDVARNRLVRPRLGFAESRDNCVSGSKSPVEGRRQTNGPCPVILARVTGREIIIRVNGIDRVRAVLTPPLRSVNDRVCWYYSPWRRSMSARSSVMNSETVFPMIMTGQESASAQSRISDGFSDASL